jgi:hypothetical protein
LTSILKNNKYVNRKYIESTLKLACKFFINLAIQYLQMFTLP